jgi:hypothetical protein
MPSKTKSRRRDVTRLQGSPLEGFDAAPYDCLEVIELTSLVAGFDSF